MLMWKLASARNSTPARVAYFSVMALTMSVIAGCVSAAEQPSSLLVLNKSDNTLAIVNPKTLKVEATVPTGVGPHEVITTRDGKLAIVANYGDQKEIGRSLSVIDIAARKELRRVDLGKYARPHGLAEHNGKIYVTAEVARSVVRYDPTADKIDWSVETGQEITHMLAITPDGKKIYTANILSDSVSAIDVATKKVKQIAIGPKPEGIGISPDGREVWVGQNETGKISIINTATDTVKETISIGGVPIRVHFTPDGSRVLVTNPPGGELIVLDAKTRKELKRLPLAPATVGVLVSPDGKRAFVASMAANKVFVIDMNTLKLAGDIQPGGAPDGLAWATART